MSTGWLLAGRFKGRFGEPGRPSLELLSWLVSVFLSARYDRIGLSLRGRLVVDA